MKCERIENALIAYVDGRASGADRRKVEAHLAACGACRRRAEEFRVLWGVLDELPTVEASPAFDARLHARIAEEPARESFWTWLVPAPRLAVATVLLLTMSVWISSLPPGEISGPVPTDTARSEAEFRMIDDLPVLEDYDVVASFEVLSELPPQPVVENKGR